MKKKKKKKKRQKDIYDLKIFCVGSFLLLRSILKVEDKVFLRSESTSRIEYNKFEVIMERNVEFTKSRIPGEVILLFLLSKEYHVFCGLVIDASVLYSCSTFYLISLNNLIVFCIYCSSQLSYRCVYHLPFLGFVL